MTKTARNEGKHTAKADVIYNILHSLRDTSYRNGNNKSAMGYSAYPGYKFFSPQGAALSIARIARELYDEKLVAHGKHCGQWYLTAKGKVKLEELRRSRESKKITNK